MPEGGHGACECADTAPGNDAWESEDATVDEEADEGGSVRDDAELGAGNSIPVPATGPMWLNIAAADAVRDDAGGFTPVDEDVGAGEGTEARVPFTGKAELRCSPATFEIGAAG